MPMRGHVELFRIWGTGNLYAGNVRRVAQESLEREVSILRMTERNTYRRTIVIPLDIETVEGRVASLSVDSMVCAEQVGV